MHKSQLFIPSSCLIRVRMSHTLAKHRLSRMFVPTMKIAPAIADTSTSYLLLLRSGIIRQSSAGIFSFLPLGLRVISKIERIIDEEMESIDAQKLALPLLLPADNWKKTGRWEIMEGELYKLQDRKQSPYCLAPTHEEEITSLLASMIISVNQLPIKLYQIGKKYRDEKRPRSGLLRGKEFVMKDLYTFDKDEASALQTYEQVRDAYKRIFTRLGVKFAVAEADTGSIGGTRSHEYHIISKVGEDTVLHCKNCGYTANVERARGAWKGGELVEVPETVLGQWVKESLGIEEAVSVKVYGQDVVVHHPAVKINDLKLHDLKVGRLNHEPDLNTLKESNPRFIVDTSIAVNSGKAIVTDVRETNAGEACLQCSSGTLESNSAIECGHTFYLGKKYSSVLNANYRNHKGVKDTMIMGCFGIGVSRLVGAIAETVYDDEGLVWPKSIAPFQACVIPVIPKSQQDFMTQGTNNLMERLVAKFGKDEVVLDDRYTLDLKSRLSEAKLIGYPLTFVLGPKSLDLGQVELHERGVGVKMMKLETLNEEL